jgi:hypothetical protein
MELIQVRLAYLKISFHSDRDTEEEQGRISREPTTGTKLQPGSS